MRVFYSRDPDVSERDTMAFIHRGKVEGFVKSKKVRELVENLSRKFPRGKKRLEDIVKAIEESGFKIIERDGKRKILRCVSGIGKKRVYVLIKY